MSRRVMNSLGDAIAPPDRTELRMIWGSRKHRVLQQLRNDGPLTTDQLHSRTPDREQINRFRFAQRVVQPLLDQQLIKPTGQPQEWALTRLGDDELADLARRRPEDAAPLMHTGRQLEHGTTPGRSPMEWQPLPAGEYRCPRPEAYDYAAHPSRMGNERRFRDGQRMEVKA